MLQGILQICHVYLKSPFVARPVGSYFHDFHLQWVKIYLSIPIFMQDHCQMADRALLKAAQRLKIFPRYMDFIIELRSGCLLLISTQAIVTTSNGLGFDIVE